jgi:hypothetical protein
MGCGHIHTHYHGAKEAGMLSPGESAFPMLMRVKK